MFHYRRHSLRRITLSAIRMFPRFCKMFSESSTVVTQLPCCPGKQVQLSENLLQTLQNDLTVDSALHRVGLVAWHKLPIRGQCGCYIGPEFVPDHQDQPPCT